jgi:hypothetical protein
MSSIRLTVVFNSMLHLDGSTVLGQHVRHLALVRQVEMFSKPKFTVQPDKAARNWVVA